MPAPRSQCFLTHFTLSTPNIFLLFTPVDNSESTWKKTIKCNNRTFYNVGHVLTRTFSCNFGTNLKLSCNLETNLKQSFPNKKRPLIQGHEDKTSSVFYMIFYTQQEVNFPLSSFSLVSLLKIISLLF